VKNEDLTPMFSFSLTEQKGKWFGFHTNALVLVVRNGQSKALYDSASNS
jgi:hypothetical protein